MNPPKKLLSQGNGAKYMPGRQPGNPQPYKPGVAQPTTAMASQPKKQPAAPPVYRPQPAPKVLQSKMASGQPPKAGQSPRQPVAPPVYRPEPKKIVQPKTGAATPTHRPLMAPHVYRPHSTPRIQQAPRNHLSVQRMSVRGANKASVLSSDTSKKHVCAADRDAKAQSSYGPSTFVASAADITSVVDANDHNFIEENGAPSGRFDFEASVKIYQYEKDEDPPAGWAKDKPVTKTVDGADKTCEIGVKKTGDDKIQVTHFKMKL